MNGGRGGPRGKAAKALLFGLGSLCFGLGWAGIFLPGLPTTIFWIVAALCFVRTSDRAYRKVISRKRFGEPVRRFVEEGTISRRGKLVSIVAMLACASLGAVAIPPVWVKVLVLALAGAGSVWVGLLPVPRAEERDLAARASSGAAARSTEG